MRRVLFAGAFVIAFTLGGTTALAGNPSNDQRVDAAPNIPCQGLYTARGLFGGSGQASTTPASPRVAENDLELCHNGVDPEGE